MRRLIPLAILVFSLVTHIPAHAADFVANDSASWLAALAGITAAGPNQVHTITVTDSFSLEAEPQPVFTQNSTILIEGGGSEIDGAGQFRILPLSGLGTVVTVQNLTVRNGSSAFATGCIGASGVGELRLNNVLVEGCRAGGAGGGINSVGGGNLVIENSTIRNNTSDAFGGGVNAELLTVTNTTFDNNTAPDGGGIFSDGDVTVTGSTFVTNTGGGLTAQENGQTVTITGSDFLNNTGGGLNTAVFIGGGITLSVGDSCFLGNDLGVNNRVAAGLLAANGNWWGAPSGPAGFGDSISTDVVVDNRLTVPPRDCPTVPYEAVPDYYSARVGEDLVITTPDRGVIANDRFLVGVDPANTAAYPSVRGGQVAMNVDGTFTYTPPGTGGIDAFEYRGTDGGQGRPFGLVCVSVSDLEVETPPPQNAQSGVPLPVPDVRVESDTPPTSLVKVTLRVQNGVLNVNAPDGGNVGDPLIDQCDPSLFDTGGAVAAGPSVVWSGGGGKHAATSMSAPLDTLAQDANPFAVSGNNTSELTLSGDKVRVNAELANLTYTSNQGFQGVDQVVITAEEGGARAFGSVVIIVSPPPDPIVEDPGDGPADPPPDPIVDVPVEDDEVIVEVVLETGEDTTVVEAFVAPLQTVLLRDLSARPNTTIRGEVPPGAVPNGDVYVNLFVAGGQLLVGAAEIDDPFLLQLGILQSAEVFGLAAGGSSVPGFDGTVTVCLRGGGAFFFRDATRAPRISEQLQTFTDGAFTCAFLPNSGTVILVPGMVASTINVDSFQAARRLPLTDCMVTTRNILNLREGPGTSTTIVRPIQFNITLTAFTFVDGWYEVDYLGQTGWISADFVEPQGTCE